MNNSRRLSKKPADILIQQIKDLISSGILRAEDRLLSERVLVEHFGVGRGHIREAVKNLEFYRILKAIPQNGTSVANLGVKAREGLISNILTLEKEDRARICPRFRGTDGFTQEEIKQEGRSF